jgi:protocatechuate 3,4-dioxygenase beta subunit
MNSGGITRRRVIGMAAGTLASTAMAADPLLGQTPPQVLGPFYPVRKPTDHDADLTRVAGKAGRAAGQVLHIAGRLINRHGQPLVGAKVEIWQANTHGRYAHPNDRNPAPLDPNFEGYASLTTDEVGGFSFTTVKPGAYPAGGGPMRPPHIHFDITGKISHLTTQMYFAGEPLNENDRILSLARDRARQLIVKLEPASAEFERGTLMGQWDVVLEEG